VQESLARLGIAFTFFDAIEGRATLDCRIRAVATSPHSGSDIAAGLSLCLRITEMCLR